MSIRLLQVKGQRILRAGRPAYVRKESQGLLVIRATANKSLTSVLNGELCCAHCLYVPPVTRGAYICFRVYVFVQRRFKKARLQAVVINDRMVAEL
jgi:hypothetical protein